MSDTEELAGPQAPFTITLKGGSGYDKPWLVLRAESAEDAVALLGEAQAAELLDRIAEYSSEFQSKNGAAASSANGTQGGSPSPRGTGSRGSSSRGAAAPSQPAQSDVEYHPEGKTCSKAGCGAPVIYKKIAAKTGKTFEMWVCENQRERNDGHHSEFIN